LFLQLNTVQTTNVCRKILVVYAWLNPLTYFIFIQDSYIGIFLIKL
jgi:hypothetical protein